MDPHQPAGSPASGEPDFLVIGKLLRPHGLRGEMVMEILTDFPERLKPGVQVFLGDQHLPLNIKSCRKHGSRLLLAFKGFGTPEATEAFRHSLVFVASSDRPPLPDGEYYHHQLIGLRVEDEQGKYLGKLNEVLVTGANDVFVIKTDEGKEFLIPSIPTVILDINLEINLIRIHLLDGLLLD